MQEPVVRISRATMFHYDWQAWISEWSVPRRRLASRWLCLYCCSEQQLCRCCRGELLCQIVFGVNRLKQQADVSHMYWEQLRSLQNDDLDKKI